MKVQKVVFTDKSWDFVDKEGKSHKTTMYRLVLDNDRTIPIKPLFSDDYPKLDIISEVVKIDTPKKSK